MEDEFFAVYHYSMAGVIAALISYDKIRRFGENIDYLALSFVPPLGADYNNVHKMPFYLLGAPTGGPPCAAGVGGVGGVGGGAGGV